MDSINVPFFDKGRKIIVPDWGTIHLKSYQILLLVCVTEQRLDAPPSRTPLFPALFDTGHSHCFSLSKEQFDAATTRGRPLPLTNKIYSFKDAAGTEHKAKGWYADIWLHNFDYQHIGNQTHKIQRSAGLPLKLALAQEGIGCVVPPEDSTQKKQGNRLKGLWEKVFGTRAAQSISLQESEPMPRRLRDSSSNRLALPHLPLLGLRALCLNGLQITMICTHLGGTLTIEPIRPRSPREI
jgi:hypothetical protein